MKIISLGLASVVLSAATAWAQVIPVSTFGPNNALNTDFVTLSQGTAFGAGNNWTVTGPATSTVDLEFKATGNGGFNSPDGNATVDLDGSSVGQIKTMINVPGVGLEALIFTSTDGPLGSSSFNAGALIGTVTASQSGSTTTISFWVTANENGPPISKNYSVTLGNVTQNESVTAINNPSSPDWTFDTVTFSSVAPPSVPDNGGTVMLLGVAFAGLALARRMTSVKA